MAEGRLEKLESAGDVGGDEFTGAVDRAVDMRFGGQVHDGVRLGAGEGAAHGFGITDVGTYEREAWLALQVRKGGKVAGVGELIDDYDFMSFAMRKPGEIGTDEAGAAGDEEFHWG